MLVHVLDESMATGAAQSIPKGSEVDLLRKAGFEVLDEVAAVARRAGVSFEENLLGSFGQRPADVLVNEVTRQGADVIVQGTHGLRGLKRLALGSDAELMLRHSPVPVLIVRARRHLQSSPAQ